MEMEHGSFKLNYRIVNKTRHELIVRAKGGLGYIIRKCKEANFSADRTIYVEMTSVYFNNLIIDEKAALTLFDKRLLKEIKLEVERIRNANNCTPDVFPHNVMVSIKLGDHLVERNDAIHSEILGITLYPNAEHADAPAMNTPGYVLKELLETKAEGMETPKGGLHCFIHVNDVRRVSNPYFMNIMGQALEVPIVNDPDRESGIYIGMVYGNEIPHTVFYTFEGMDKSTRESVGLFLTKAECELNGNTERLLKAERKVVDHTKEIHRLVESSQTLQQLLDKSTENNVELNKTLSQVRLDNKAEMNVLKHEHWVELSQLKHQSKMTGDIFKFETRVKDTVSKANMDFVKQRSSVNTWGEFTKAFGAIAGLAFTGYQLFTK